MIHPIQEQLLKLSKKHNLAKLSLRDMANRIGLPEASPQKIKHHLTQLEKKGFLAINRARGVMQRASAKPDWAKGLPVKSSTIFSIPIIGTADCGIATIFAEANFQGILRISNKLVGIDFPDDLYAVKTEGSSMNKAEVKGKKIEDGDYVIVNGVDKDISNNDIVLAIIDSKATIKRFIDDRLHKQIVLKADSSFDYDPIYLHPDDDFNISGKVVAVVKNPG
ncbi:hypothetical protein COT93_00640 [Candidatus Falkowbacteria bacterium CG10_big_fil_rev_8_21_14_0_10_37_18]|uniref:Peptidase S24/S26A/S26B/S26C domain-containing protein n=1 Tax=Candidatus Falkowbacteria bacterium CG10_big_fil_rev_8_21_14_0_10_37_18 TaxID=1974562 RepID=A0A2H0V9L4_9BACT|nr:MAG: hypothetical protein COT93_00640 [Candidatus Falkowbacteria bacterium CG10_big_fil_rev_8_21_14_0_10_37_18]